MNLSSLSQPYLMLSCLFPIFSYDDLPQKSQDQGDSRKYQTTQSHYNLPILILYLHSLQLPLVFIYTLGASLEMSFLLEIWR